MPIIESTSRKDVYALTQLFRYVEQDQKFNTFSIKHNIDRSSNDINSICKEFQENDNYRKKRKGGVILYHDILAFHPKDFEILIKDPHIIEELARAYLMQRCPNALAYGKLHIDKKHLHVHLIISPNEKGCSKSIRISKKEFSMIKKEVEKQQKIKFPELKYSYSNYKISKSLSNSQTII